LDEVLSETRALVGLGYKEIVLSGINLGRWGRDFAAAEAALSATTSLARLKACPDTKRTRFVDLLRAMLAETDIQKIRISSVEPMDWSDELIEVVANSPRVCKHAHVPLQSGSDRILRRMHRKYRPWHYADRIQKIRAAMPTAAIGADVMVGFPGETDEQFEETRAFIESLPFTYLHVFTYSSRPGTPSASMPDQVRGDVTRERNRVLRELVARKKREFQEQFIGRELEAITLTNFEDGQTEGLTDNYQKVWIDGRQASNQLVKIMVQGIESEALTGAIRS
jgi:threonylcarbamoyladenosine tRNA methylthiotransferase MtaB